LDLRRESHEKSEKSDESASEHERNTRKSPGMEDRQHPSSRAEQETDQSNSCTEEDDAATMHCTKEDEKCTYAEYAPNGGVGEIHRLAVRRNPLVRPISRNHHQGRNAERELETNANHQGDPDGAMYFGVISHHARV
jgi:hypothetical protein